MYNAYIMRRTQIYLDEAQADELARRASVRGTTASKMIREAIDEYLAEADDERDRVARMHRALDASFGVAPYLPAGATYVDELRRADVERQEELEGRRRT
jgi:Ribbon-helix-helix protein, copG family